MKQSFQILLCVIRHILFNNIPKANDITRTIAKKAYQYITSKKTCQEIYDYIDSKTGGLGYREKRIGKDWERVVTLGCYIAWADITNSDSHILEIGTGLGRTLYCMQYNSPKEIVTLEIDPFILAIALYSNPYQPFQEALWKPNTHILLGDAVLLALILKSRKYRFNHIVHDGGPNPEKNPRLYNRFFLSLLYDLLVNNGTISVFAGRNPHYVSRIYNLLKRIGFVNVYVVSPPGINVKIVRGVKPGKVDTERV